MFVILVGFVILVSVILVVNCTRILKLTLTTKNIQPGFEAEKFLGYSFCLKVIGDGGL